MRHNARNTKYSKLYRVRKKKSILNNRLFRSGVLSGAFFSILFYFLFFSEVFQIKEIIVSGAGKIPAEEIKSFFPAKNIFLVNSAKLKDDILDKFPQIAKIEIKRRFPGTLSVLAQERIEKAVWCQQEKCFFVDEEGIIFGSASGTERDLSRITKSVSAEAALGQKIIDRDLLSGILKIEKELRAQPEVFIKEFLIASDGKLEAVIKENWKIYFDPQKDLDWQLTKLKAVLESEIPESSRKNLEYIDLRFGNLAPYKYR